MPVRLEDADVIAALPQCRAGIIRPRPGLTAYNGHRLIALLAGENKEPADVHAALDEWATEHGGALELGKRIESRGRRPGDLVQRADRSLRPLTLWLPNDL